MGDRKRGKVRVVMEELGCYRYREKISSVEGAKRANAITESREGGRARASQISSGSWRREALAPSEGCR